MSETKHTAGSWKYGVRRDGSIWLSLGDPASGPHYQGDPVATESDARLISAAPELLEALEAFVRWSERLASYAGSQWADDHNLSQECHWLNESRKEAIAAIAKATGEPR